MFTTISLNDGDEIHYQRRELMKGTAFCYNFIHSDRSFGHLVPVDASLKRSY